VFSAKYKIQFREVIFMAVKTCKKCGEDNLETAVLCISCGSSLSKGKENDVNEQVIHKKRGFFANLFGKR